MVTIPEAILAASDLIDESNELDRKITEKEILFDEYEKLKTALIARNTELVFAFKESLAHEYGQEFSKKVQDKIFYTSWMEGQNRNGYQGAYQKGGYQAVASCYIDNVTSTRLSLKVQAVNNSIRIKE